MGTRVDQISRGWKWMVGEDCNSRRESGGAVRGTGVCEKENTPENKKYRNVGCLEHQIKGWIAASAEGLQGKGWHKRSVFSQTPVVVVCRGPQTVIPLSAKKHSFRASLGHATRQQKLLSSP